MKKFLRPHWFFLVLAIIMLVIGLLNRGKTIDLAYSGSLIKTSIWSVYMISAVFFGLIFINYFSIYLIGKKPKKWLTGFHIFLQLLALFPLFYFTLYQDSLTNYQEISAMNFILLISFVIFLMASLLHLINFMMSLFVKKD